MGIRVAHRPAPKMLVFESILPALFLTRTAMAPLEPAVASHVPYTVEACKSSDILLWKMKVELAGVEMREMELVHAIAV